MERTVLTWLTMTDASSWRGFEGSSGLSEGELYSKSRVGGGAIAIAIGVVPVGAGAVDVKRRKDWSRWCCNGRGAESGCDQCEFDDEHCDGE